MICALLDAHRSQASRLGLLAAISPCVLCNLHHTAAATFQRPAAGDAVALSRYLVPSSNRGSGFNSGWSDCSKCPRAHAKKAL